MSREFTMQITDIFSKMGLKSYIFDGLRPTPELSFAVRYKKACAAS
jgi:phosphoglucomutase